MTEKITLKERFSVLTGLGRPRHSKIKNEATIEDNQETQKTRTRDSITNLFARKKPSVSEKEATPSPDEVPEDSETLVPSGEVLFTNELDKSSNTEARLCFQGIAVITQVLRQDKRVRHNPTNSLLKRLGYDAENLEQILQCAFKQNIRQIMAHYGGTSSPSSLVLNHILKYEAPNELTGQILQAKEGEKPKAFQELIQAMSPFVDLLREPLEDIGHVAKYLTNNNTTIEKMEKSMREVPSPIDKIDLALVENEAKKSILQEQASTEEDPIKLDKIGTQLRTYIEHEFELNIKKAAFLGLENLNLKPTDTSEVVEGEATEAKNKKFHAEKIQNRLFKLGLVSRSIPKNYDWEPVRGDIDTRFYLHLLEGLRRDIIRTRNPEAIRAMEHLDPDGTFMSEMLDESYDRSIDEIILTHFEDLLEHPEDQAAFISKIEEVARTIGAAFDNTPSVEGRVLAYLNAKNLSPQSLARDLNRDPEMIGKLIRKRDEMLENAGKKPSKKTVREISGVSNSIAALRSFEAILKQEKTDLTREIPGDYKWELISNDDQSQSVLSYLFESLGNFLDVEKDVLINVDLDGSLLRAIEEKRINSTEDLAKLILIHCHDVDLNDPESLKQKIVEIGRMMPDDSE